jgi:hypothetical protein
MIGTLRAALRQGLSRGWAAARENLLPGLFIQALMALLVVGYYRQWPTTALLDFLAGRKRAWGIAFSFLASGIFGGILSEGCKIAFLQHGRWRRGNGEDLVFKFVLVGFCGICSDTFYLAMAHLLGTVVTPGVVLAKAALDQFVYSAFFSVPLVAIVTHWKNGGYRASAWADFRTAAFFTGQVIPLLITNWCFWGPLVFLLYALPLPLQLPLFLLALTVWGLLFVSVTARRAPVPLGEAA